MKCRFTTRPRQLHPSGKHRQSGVALLTALLIVSLATIIAVNITERQQYDIRRVGNHLYSEQAYYYALGGESWARGLLYRDHKSKSTKNTDNLFEDWAQPLPTTAIEGGSIAGQIIDLQGRFNLNNLYKDDNTDAQQVKRHKEQFEYFDRLLKALDIKENIAQAIVDWMDKDSDINFPDGAEDDNYSSKTPPYRTANRRMSSPTELMLIEGISPEIYAKLKPFVCTLPADTTININTAPTEVIAALSTQIDLQKATEIVEDRAEVFDTNDEFYDATNTYAVDKNKYQLEIVPLIGVSSQYFQVQAQVQMGDVTKYLTSTLKRRADSKLEVISRSPGTE